LTLIDYNFWFLDKSCDSPEVGAIS